MRYFNLTFLLVICLISAMAINTGCTEATAENNTLAAQSSNDTDLAAGVPSFVLPADLQTEESTILMANVEFGTTAEHELGQFALKVDGKKLDVYTADGKMAGSFRLSGGKLVPSNEQPMDNQVKSTYSGPPGDNYSAYRVYPASHKTGDGMKPFFELDYNGGALSLTPGKDVTITSRGKSRGKKNTNTGSAGGSCGPGGSVGGGG